MPSAVGSGLTLDEFRLYCSEPVTADIARALAGGSREAWELIRGQSAVTGEPPVTGRNPQGLVGVDLSGPPWGSAIRHPLVWHNRRVTTGFLQPDPTNKRFSFGRPLVLVVEFWNRPHDKLPQPEIAPYSLGVVWVRWSRVTGATTPTVNVTSRNLTLGQPPEQRRTASATGPASTTESTELFSSAFYVDLTSGHNAIELTFDYASSGNVAAVSAFGLNQMSKRGH